MSKVAQFLQIEKNIKTCTKCRLCQTATNAVPGEGNMNSEIVFIGEAPGANEDATGRPFVGRAGKLLDYMLNTIGYSREEVWIGNIVKHRPPNNRDPLPDEIAACRPFLDLQIKIIDPILIITLGRFAMNHFYPEGKITRDHGNLVSLQNYRIFPVYHPAAGLRNGAFAVALKKDFAKIPQLLKEIKEKSGSIKSQESSGLQPSLFGR